MSSIGAEPSRRRRKPSRVASDGDPAGQYHLKAISRALDVLDCFNESRPELTLKDISVQIGLPESTLFRILRTLESRHYLLQNPDGSYQLPPKLLFGFVQARAEHVRIKLRPHLQALAGRFDETATSAYLFDDRVHAIDTVESFHPVRMTNKPGRVLPPHASSLAKVITAFQPSTKIDRMLEVYGLVRYTPLTLTDRGAVLNEYEKIRMVGYSIEREESVAGGVCIGVAVQVEGGPTIAAMSVSVPTIRMSDEREIEIAQALLEAARQASLDLQGQPA